MGTWTIYEVWAEDLTKTDPFIYAIAQAAAAADVISASSGNTGEGDVTGFPLFVKRIEATPSRRNFTMGMV